MSTNEANNYKFIVDQNVGRLALWLRMMGYNTIVFDQTDDWQMIRIALSENRIMITRDTGVMKRRVIIEGKIKTLFVNSENPEEQIGQVIDNLKLSPVSPFSRCLECNAELMEVLPESVREQVPPYVYETHRQFMQCPVCHRVYWRGTHWQEMLKTIKQLTRSENDESRTNI
jgi:uncharacterized protein